ncbi:MAG: cellulase family glycosylhydrolase [Planctomycetes bacterium]|nr:cellulase family glycosylhydrolase [Planctomycetota bacterium]
MAGKTIKSGSKKSRKVAKNPLPRWRGFNLLSFFSVKWNSRPVEDDFRWIADWGFDFIRLPMSYLLWTQSDDIFKVKEDVLEQIDQAVDLARRCGLHVCLNFHRAPGYTISSENPETLSLWKEQKPLDAFCFHWELFTRRYKGISSRELSFNLVNEPPVPSRTVMTKADYERVVRAAVAAIRRIDPDRLIIADGISVATEPVPELADVGIAQSCRGYRPMSISHHKAHWCKTDHFPPPAWPGVDESGETWDRRRLAEYYAPWGKMIGRGVGVHCGECGCHNLTPHGVFLAWLEDVLSVLTGLGIGYALWNFRGPFGVLDSKRDDVEYQDWHGRLLDRKMLDLLRESGK